MIELDDDVVEAMMTDEGNLSQTLQLVTVQEVWTMVKDKVFISYKPQV